MDFWRNCSSCKKEIPFNSKFFECSVSTCTGKRTGYVFCSVPCFERHLPGARHRDAGAVEMKSPSKEQFLEEQRANLNTAENSTTSPQAPQRRIIPSHSATTTAAANVINEDDILIVVSKMKNYIRDKSEMNTSGDVAEVLSHFVRRLCDDAIVRARNDGRKTVMGRDFSDKN